MIIERFSPEGGHNTVDNKTMDDLLEEELTWNTGFKYIRPYEYIPFIGFQTLSNETNINNIKNGDPRGFVLHGVFGILKLN